MYKQLRGKMVIMLLWQYSNMIDVKFIKLDYQSKMVTSILQYDIEHIVHELKEN